MRSGWPLPAVAVLAAVLPPSVRAQTAPLTLEDCLRLALASPSAVDVARGQRQIAELGITETRAARLPQVKVDGAFTYNSPLDGTSDVPSHVALNGIREYQALVTAMQELDTSGRLRAASARARANRDAAEAGVRIAERDLKRAVAGAYYRLLLARRLADVARDALAEAQRFEGRTRQLFEKGESARGDLVKASAQAAFLEQAVSAADLEAEIANHDLASYWSASVDEKLSVVDVLEDPVPPEALEGSGENPFLRRPEWARMEAERAGFLAEARRLHGERLPQASFTFQYGLDALRFDWEDRGYAAFFSLSVPVFDWSRSKSASRQFQLQADEIALERRMAERTFSRAWSDALARVRAANAQIELTRRQVSLSEENLRISRIRYEGGEGSALDVVTAQSDLANARTNYFTALARHLEARADLAVAGGQ